MDVNKILKADVLDIIFEGRNKEYGAYDLRKTYNKRITRAIIGTSILCFLIVTYQVLAGLRPPSTSKIIVEDVSLENLKQDEKKPEPPPPPPPPKQEPPKVEITKFTPPKIVKDEEVKEDEKPPEQEKLEDTKIGTINQEGDKTNDIVAPPVQQSTGQVEAPKQEEDYDKLFTSVQIESEFPGGQAGWIKYLERNLNADAPKDEGAPPGKIQVEVSFTVDKEGNISDVSAEKVGGGNDYGTKAEAIKVIQKGPKWNPGIQNGIKVKSRKKQRVTFVINEE